jgi:hypothetical protein
MCYNSINERKEKERKTMTWILPVYVIVGVASCFVGIAHADDPHWSVNWGMIIGLLMLVLSPLVAKISGIL